MVNLNPWIIVDESASKKLLFKTKTFLGPRIITIIITFLFGPFKNYKVQFFFVSFLVSTPVSIFRNLRHAMLVSAE